MHDEPADFYTHVYILRQPGATRQRLVGEIAKLTGPGAPLGVATAPDIRAWSGRYGRRMQQILISGAARGIGLATAQLFHARGWRVGLYDIDAEQVARSAKQLLADDPDDTRVMSGALDVRERGQWDRSLAEFSPPGGIDVLMNNAGVLSSGAFVDMSPEVHQRIVDVNVHGVLNGAQAGYEYLHRANGILLNVCSASSMYGQPTLATYSATKAAVKSLTESLELEWHRKVHTEGVRVRSLLPMFVDTDMVRVDGTRIGNTRLFGVRLSAEDVARAAWRLVHESDWPVTLRAPHRAVGLQTHVLAAASAVSPAWMTRQIVKLSNRA